MTDFPVKNKRWKALANIAEGPTNLSTFILNTHLRFFLFYTYIVTQTAKLVPCLKKSDFFPNRIFYRLQLYNELGESIEMAASTCWFFVSLGAPTHFPCILYLLIAIKHYRSVRFPTVFAYLLLLVSHPPVAVRVASPLVCCARSLHSSLFSSASF